MRSTDIILQERHRDEVRDLVADESGAEGAAYVLFGRSDITRDPMTCAPRSRYTSFEVIPIPDEDRISSSERHVTWNTRSFVNLCRRAKEEQLVPGIVNRSGFSGGSKSRKDWSHGKGQQSEPLLT